MALRSARRIEVWLPCLAETRPQRALAGGRSDHAGGQGELRGERPHLWRPSDLARRAGSRLFVRLAQDRTSDARSGAAGAATQARAAERRRRTFGFGDRPECARPPVHGGPAQPQMDCRLHLCLDGRGLALRRRGDRSVFAPRRRLVDEGRDERATRHRRVVNGDLAARAPGCALASLRPWQPIHQRAVPTSDGRQWCRLFDEPFRKRMGQRRHGKLLLVAQNRTDRPNGLPYAGRRQGRRVRLHRKILQRFIRTHISLCG